MRRSLLLTLTVLGALVTLAGGTGLFAALTDSASTGTNNVSSASLQSSSDLQLATGTFVGGSPSTVSCDQPFSDNLTSGFFTLSDLQPDAYHYQWFCIRNAGSAPVTVSGAVTELLNTDFACTGDEADHGDATCGGDAEGEFGAVLKNWYAFWDCNNAGSAPASNIITLNASTAPVAFGTIGAGQTRCFTATIYFPTDLSTADYQRSQSDRVTWRYTFTGQA